MNVTISTGVLSLPSLCFCKIIMFQRNDTWSNARTYIIISVLPGGPGGMLTEAAKKQKQNKNMLFKYCR